MTYVLYIGLFVLCLAICAGAAYWYQNKSNGYEHDDAIGMTTEMGEQN